METRSDYYALDIIAMILNQFHKEKPDSWNYEWAIAMIEHEVNLTGRDCGPVSEPAEVV